MRREHTLVRSRERKGKRNKGRGGTRQRKGGGAKYRGQRAKKEELRDRRKSCREEGLLEKKIAAC